MPPTPPTGDYVLANFRYLSAYNELVARISQRQQTLTLFVAIFTGLVTALIAARDVFPAHQMSVAWLMAGFPFASLALTFLNFKYENLLTILREYLAELERVQGADGFFPSFNCNPVYVERANRARHFHDLTCALMILAYNVVAIGIFEAIRPPGSRTEALVEIAVGAVGLASVLAHFGLRRAQYRVRAGTANG